MAILWFYELFIWNKRVIICRKSDTNSAKVFEELFCANRVEFSQLTAEYKAVNLGQGFPDFSPPKFIQEAFCEAVSGGPLMHQYTRAFVSKPTNTE